MFSILEQSSARPPSRRQFAGSATSASSERRTLSPYLRPRAKTHPRLPRCASPQSHCDFLFVPSRRTVPPSTSIESSPRALRPLSTRDIPLSAARYRSKRSPCCALPPQTLRAEIQSLSQSRLRAQLFLPEPPSSASPAADRSSIANCSGHLSLRAVLRAQALPLSSKLPRSAPARRSPPNRTSLHQSSAPAPPRSIH